MPDLRLALRVLAKSPGFAAAVPVLALGIGVDTARFPIVEVAGRAG